MKKVYLLVLLLVGLIVAVALVQLRQNTRSKASFGPVSKINIAWYDLKNKAGFSADAVNEIGQIVDNISYQWGLSSAGIGSLNIHSNNRYVEFIPNGNTGRADIWVVVDGGIKNSIGIVVNANGTITIADSPSSNCYYQPIQCFTQPCEPIWVCATPIPTPTTAPNVCIQDAKQCPDGSYVARTGPNCEFAPCPSSKPTLQECGQCDFRSTCDTGLICYGQQPTDPNAGMAARYCIKPNGSSVCNGQSMPVPTPTPSTPNMDICREVCTESYPPTCTIICDDTAPIPTQTAAKPCGWCGNDCVRLSPNLDRACNNALPLSGSICYENNGECVIKQSDTAVSIKARTVGNFNGDSKIDIFDYNIFIAGFVRKEPTIDITGDGKIDIFDYNILVSNFGK